MALQQEAAALPALASAWSRYWARSLDVMLWMLLLVVLGGLLLPQLAEVGSGLDAPLSDQLFGMLLLPFAMAGDVLTYLLFGNTPGKWLAGLAVRNAAGARLAPLRYLRRNLAVYLHGLALGIGLVALFTLVHQHHRVRSGMLTSWDEREESRVVSVRGGAWRTSLTAVLYLVLTVGSIGIGLYLSSLTPEQQLQLMASSASPAKPTMVDENLRLDRIYVAPGRVLEYDYTLLGVSAADDPGFGARLQQTTRASLVQEFCTDLTIVADLGGSVRWRYADSSGQLLHAIEVSKKDCPAHH